MGLCFSGSRSHLIEQPDGDEEAFHARFLEDQTLGEGEFGVVKLVHDKDGVAYACKILRKGVTFKDNTIYSPIKPEVLRGEVEMLRALRINNDNNTDNTPPNYCLQLIAIYETSRHILMVTEFCAGGEMMEYVAAQTQDDLTIQDVSRIAFQLLSAVDHCAKHDIIHRDIKPENCMFVTKQPKADLRLIDFGSGTIGSMRVHKNKGADAIDTTTATATTTTDPNDFHTTFAGSAFYISPEMFQHKYTQRTDVWSAIVTIYVLVAGYPADELQKAFNILQTSGSKRNLRCLPNLPDDLPDSFYELLEGGLVYRYKKRPSAGELLRYEFVQAHNKSMTALSHEENDDTIGLCLDEVADAISSNTTASPFEKESIRNASLRGSIARHNLFLGFKQYERALTTLLAAMLSKKQLEQFLSLLRERLQRAQKEQQDTEEKKTPSDLGFQQDGNNVKSTTNEQKLSVIPVHELKRILREDMKNEQILETMDAIPNASAYENFAYHVALLREFTHDPEEFGAPPGSSGRRKSLSKSDRRSIRRNISSGRLEVLGNVKVLTDSNGSSFSTASGRAGRRRKGRMQRSNSTSSFKRNP